MGNPAKQGAAEPIGGNSPDRNRNHPGQYPQTTAFWTVLGSLDMGKNSGWGGGRFIALQCRMCFYLSLVGTRVTTRSRPTRFAVPSRFAVCAFYTFKLESQHFLAEAHFEAAQILDDKPCCSCRKMLSAQSRAGEPSLSYFVRLPCTGNMEKLGNAVL